jgi:hypothetical protein
MLIFVGLENGIEACYPVRLDMDHPKQALKSATFANLESVRGELRHQLPSLVSVKHVCGKDSEFWSARKLLRRAFWHERDHTHHILKLLGLVAENYPA